MIVCALLKSSFSDYLGKMAAVMYQITRGCNFRCPWSHNPGLVDFSVDYKAPFEQYPETVGLVDPAGIRESVAYALSYPEGCASRNRRAGVDAPEVLNFTKGADSMYLAPLLKFSLKYPKNVIIGV